MGIDYDSKVILGIRVENEDKLHEFLIKNKIGTCLNDYDDPKFKLKDQCFCIHYCWDLTQLPKGIYIIQTGDSYSQYHKYFVSMINDRRNLNLTELSEVMNNVELHKSLVDFVNNNNLINSTATVHHINLMSDYTIS
jgi:hypothetical protein